MSRSKIWLYPFVAFLKIKITASFFRRVIRKLFGNRIPDRDGSIPRIIPKTIWIYWDQGEASAPDLVQHCIASWRDQNPGWDVRVIDQASLTDTLELPELPTGIPVQAFSDLLRLRLLKEHGGVWADATAYCLKPLDHWLPPMAQRGFFAFSWTEKDLWFLWPGVFRSIGSWFLASENGGKIVTEWERYSFAYWEGREKAHIYFWLHMIFEYLNIASRSFRQNYMSTPKIGCFSAHLIYDCVLRGDCGEHVRAALEAGAAPIQKLRWDWSGDDLDLAKQLLRSAGAKL